MAHEYALIVLQQAYTSYDLEATAWSYSFYDEAEQLLEHETAMGMATPNTVAAMLYLRMSATCHAKSTTAATEHLDHAIDLAKSIGLFGIADEGMPERWPDEATDFLWENSLAQTAWGSFVYITLPIPGDAENFEDAKSPDGPHFSAYMGTTFPYLCKLALIAHDMIWVNYGNILRVEGYSMIEHMEVLYRRYLSWADRLPLELLESFTSQQASPEAICLASATQLGGIVATYLQRYSSASQSFLWITALLYFANAVIRELGRAADISEKLADLRTCIFGYQRLQRSFRLSYGIIRSLLSMALREGAVGSLEARAIMNDTDERAKHHRGYDEVRAPFVVDLDLGTLDPVAAHVDRLAAEFEELAIFNEFTVVNSGREATNTSI
ncbi:C6 transcription factor [Colletotrichum tofieldiae]|nr:C6 transcription factor [Colletotrichum tofieldiae]